MIDAARLRISLADIDPSPWREIEVPLSMSLKNLHDAIQAAFLWHDSHLWEFDIEGKRYGLPYDDNLGGERIHKASTTKLMKLHDQGVTQFIYTYDMGDNWEHLVEVIQVFESESGARLPRFIAGEHHAPPDDVGGPPGFEVFLNAINNPKHREHRHFKDWYGEAFDPTEIEEETIRALLGRMAKARPKKV